MISLFLRGFLAFGATAVALFFTLTMTMTLTMTDYPTPAPPLKGAGSLVNLKAYFVGLIEKLTKYEIPNI